MTEKPSEPTQRTPQGEEIPVPTKSTFLDNLKKVAKVGQKPTDSTPGGPEK